MPRKETKYRGYYRKRLRDPSGKYVDVYGKTIQERDDKVEDLRSIWRAQTAQAAQIYVVDYCRLWYSSRQ